MGMIAMIKHEILYKFYKISKIGLHKEPDKYIRYNFVRRYFTINHSVFFSYGAIVREWARRPSSDAC